MSSRISGARASLALLTVLFAGLIATACGSSSSPASQSSSNHAVPSPGAAPQLTARQILERSREAFDTVVSYRNEGGFLSYPKDRPEEAESGTMISEWTAPDRSSQVVTQEHSGEIKVTQTITIGDRGYHLNPFFDGEWQEVKIIRPTPPADAGVTDPPDSNDIRLDLLAYVVPDEPPEVVEFEGKVAYRITGTADGPDLGSYDDPNYESEARFVIHIDAASFLLLRDERVIKTRNTVEEIDARSGASSTYVEESVIEFSFDFTYSDEPLVIERPQNYIPFPEDRSTDPALLPTPTPVVRDDVPTPTAVPGPVNRPPVGLLAVTPAPPTLYPSVRFTPTPGPFPRPPFAENDPNRHIPFYIYQEPWYDKLELGDDVIVSYVQCNVLNSIGDRPYLISINYMPEGSVVATGAWTGSEFYVDNADGFTHQRFQSDEGRAALEAVLNDPETVARVIHLSDPSARCPAEFLSYTGDTFEHLPETDWFRIDDETVARFESCDTTGTNLAAPILVAHLPSETVVAVTPGSYADILAWQAQPPRNREHLWSVLNDGFLRIRLAELAPREARCE